MSHRSAGVGVGLGLLCLACGPVSVDRWAGVEADSPCYRVDLGDGVADGAELRELFDCLDHHGHLDAFAPAVDGLSPEALDEGALLVNGLGDAGLSGLDALDALLPLLDEGAAFADALDAGLELCTGEVASSQGGSAATSPLRHLATLVPDVAEAWRSDPGARQAFTDTLLAEDLPTLLRQTAELVEGPRAGPILGAFPAAASLLATTRSPQNDRLPGATGQSLRDLVDVSVLDPEPALAELGPPLADLLLDAPLREDLVARLPDLDTSGAAEGVAWLVEIDASGGALSPGELSAFARLVRLVATTNGPVDCELDLWITSFEWSFPNLAVRILQIVASMEPGAVQSAAGVLDAITGNALGEVVLEAAIDAGTCPTFTRDTLDDLDAVARLAEPEAIGLLVALGPVLSLLDAHDQLGTTADVVSALHASRAVAPLEELLRDVGPAPATADVLAGIQAACHPLSDGTRPFERLLERAGRLLDGRGGPSELERVLPALRPLLAPDASWAALSELGDLAARPGSQLGRLPATAPSWVAADPELVTLDLLLALDRPDVVDPALVLASDEAFVGALLVTEGDAVPLDWLAARIRDGSVRDVLLTLREAVAEAGG